MQYEARTPAEYFEALEDDWRRISIQELQLCAVILEEDPALSKETSYKMLDFKDDDALVFHINAPKTFVGFHVGNVSAIDPSDEFLEGLSTGKGCIRFTKTKPVAETAIR